MNAPADGVRIEAALRALQDDAVPTKTARGREELKCRRGELRPRLRSLLLLADGQRSLADLRRMALQTGAAAQDVDELLRAGYIELPAAAALVPVPAPAVAAVAAPAVVATIEPLAARAAQSPSVAPPRPAPQASSAAPDAGSKPPHAAPAAAPAEAVARRRTDQPHALAPSHDRPETPPAPLAVQKHDAPPAPAQRAPAAPPLAQVTIEPPAPAPGPATADATAALHTARELLRDWLVLDGARGNRRLRSLLTRVDEAADVETLAVLLEEAEAEIPPARRSHQGLLRISQLRDVLGLGNTRVAEDTLPGVSADEAGAWASTLPGE